MASFRLSYAHDDRLVGRAVREIWWSPKRRRDLRRFALFALGAAAFLVLVEALPGTTPSTTMRAIMLAPSVLLVLGVVGLGLVILLLPVWLTRRIRHLPHRTVEVVIDDHGIDFATANDRYSAVWSEVVATEQLASLWLLRLRNGAELVLPKDVAGPELNDWLARRTTAP
jgi:formate-dependent nitrite reductase membrane component NrfD